ncbi:c-type cytochrome [Novosphingobium bradum]|uniref:C-type cytochrome n=1 Tax=Novosphingobium bradum TaxID=1737444 RepID=A0ABV7ISG9_9SPHN
MPKPITLALAALLLPAAGLALPAVVGAAAPNQVIKQRHHNFEAMGRAMKGTFDEFKRPAPSIAVIQAHANVLADAALKVKGHFPKGSGPESRVKTEALPAIWERPADFAAAADRLVGATRGLQTASATGDLAAIQKAAGAVGGSCKNCHDSFRKAKA